MLRYCLFFLLFAATSSTALYAQACSLITENINLGGSGHDLGFQNTDPVDATAILSNGNFVVAWETRDDIDGNENGGFFQVFQQDGSAVTEVTIPYADVNAGGIGEQATFGPKVVALTTGFVIAWESEDGPGDTGPTGDDQQDVFFRVYNNMGNPLSGSTRISIALQEDHVEYILPLSTGGFVLLTRIDEDDSGNNDEFFFQAFNANGVAITANPVNITSGAHDAAFQTVNREQPMVDLGNGRFVIAWESRNDVDGDGNGGFCRIFNVNGTPETGIITPYLDINPDGIGDQGTPGPKLIKLTNGNFVTAWDSELGPGDIGPGNMDDQDVYFRVYNANGTEVSATIKANSDNAGEEDYITGMIPLSGGNFAILYRTDEDEVGNTDDYFVRVFTPTGIPAGGSVEISGGAHVNNFSSIQQDNLGFIALNNGHFAIGWTARDGADGDGSGAYFRVFNAAGTAISPVTMPYADINAGGIGNQAPFGPRLKALPDGFVMAWESEQGPTDVGPGNNDDQDVYHRVIDNNGNALCGTTKSNKDNEAEEEALVALQPLVDGNFAVIYRDDEDETGNKDDYFMRIIGGAPLQELCPTLGTASVSVPAICVGEPFDLTVTGLTNMAKSSNNDQDYGVTFVAFPDPTSNPYSGGTALGTVAFANLSNAGATATLTGLTINVADPTIAIYAILDATPGDASCRPRAQTAIAANAFPTVGFTAPADLFLNDGVQSGLSGGTPAQGSAAGDRGVYAGPGVTDDGNGLTYSFDPLTAGVGVHTLSYTYTSGTGCQSMATDDIEVQPAQLVISPIDAINDLNADGSGVSLGQMVAVQGVVYCTDFFAGEGIQFWIHEASGIGIGVFSDVEVSGYVVTEGDEVIVEGEVSQFAGLLEITPSKITVVSQGNAIVAPIPTSTLTEALESKIVTLEISGVNPQAIEIVNAFNGFEIRFPKSPQDTVAVRVATATGIDAQFVTDYLNTPNIGTYIITGVVAQEDAEAPFDEKYQLYPCSEQSFELLTSINEPVWASELAIYPNPTNGHLTINASVEIEELRLIDLQGSLLQTNAVSNRKHDIDLSHLPKGVYQLQLISGDDLVNRPVVVQ